MSLLLTMRVRSNGEMAGFQPADAGSTPATRTGEWVNRVFVAKSTVPGAGRGVFSKEDVKEGELIEECAVFPFPNDLHIDRFWDYQMAWTDDHDVMASGYALIYNHSEEPNVRIERYLEEDMMRVFARRDLKAGEELFCHYCCDPWWDKKDESGGQEDHA